MGKKVFSGLPCNAFSETSAKSSQPVYTKMIQERDVMVPMRDGVRVAVDIYRPEAPEKLPALLAFVFHYKDLQTPEVAKFIPPQPAWSHLWQGNMEAGDTDFLVSRGYIHVIGNPRGVGKSDDGGSPEWDSYDLIEWIAQQPWCDGNIGMIGVSAFAGAQWQAAIKQPPHLKAIFPFDAHMAYAFRDLYPGGVLHVMLYLLDIMSTVHGANGKPGTLPPEMEHLWEEPFAESSRDAYHEPDAFVQMPPTQTNTIQRLRYMTDPLPEDTLVIGPISLKRYASIDQEDTNWIVILKDVGPDVSVHTAREGETAVPANLPERELTRGWLRASLRALDPARSKPWKPWRLLTRAAKKPVVPGEVNEYDIEISSTANLFEKGRRMCLDITSLDLPTGVGGATNVIYIPYHICSSKTVLHKVYHDEKYPSHLLLPIIPQE